MVSRQTPTAPKTSLKRFSGGDVKKYACWGCSNTYDDPADFLWHIQNCSYAKK
jgi:hypothetical protein